MSAYKNNQNTPFLSVKNLVVEYKSDNQVVHAVNGVTIELEKGKTLGLVGETGAGKTTIAKSILRILPDVGSKIVSGSILIKDQNLLKLPEHEMRKVRGNNISMIFQDPMTALNPVQKVGEQIAEVVRLHNDSQVDYEKRAKEMLELVGIPAERYHEYPHQFSGGMKQRVVIAIALACNPELLLADEPTTALDVTIQAQVMELIVELQKKNKMALLLITHDMGVVATVCDEVAVIYAGNIIEYGTKEQIFMHPSHPYTIGLFGAIPNMNEDEMWLHPIDGLPPDPTNLPVGCAFSPRCKYATDECLTDSISMYKTEDNHECRCCNINAIKKQEG
ncbi:MAG: ABC transporter ATP-binding protein [Anaerocolumna sp.]